jgi:hypothetical protein
MPTTSTAKVLFPSVDDFIFAFFYDAPNFPELFDFQTIIVRQLYLRFQPILCLALGAVDVNMLTAFFLGKEEKPKPFVSKYRWTHNLSV